MEDFEIRVLSPEGAPSLIVQHPYISANAAIGAACMIAQEKPFEVWTGSRCVYSSHPPASGVPRGTYRRLAG
jgi:hypothetical protein